MSTGRGASSRGTTPIERDPGRASLGREGITEIQRARVLSATAEVCAEHGVGNITVAHIVERAGVSRRTFYELFKDREECFLAALDDDLTRISARVVPAYRQPGRWRDRMRAALIELLSLLDEDPATGSLVIVETPAAGRRANERRALALARVIDAVHEGWREGSADPRPSRLTAEGLVGAVLTVLHCRLLEDDRSALLELTNPLMGMIVLPYLGSTAARRELSEPAPVSTGPAPARPASNLLKELDMRLTYRTVRVLLAVGENPGASNRRIAADAGVTDQGQMSRLLTRLEKHWLITNLGVGPGRGASNAWTLTEKGREVERVLAGQGTPI
jgi:AcrR family transcriptional regulator